MNQITIHNPQITLQRDRNGRTYFLITNPETNLAYFAFLGQIKRGLSDLETKWTKAKEAHLQFGSDPKKVISLRLLTRKEVRQRNKREREREA